MYDVEAQLVHDLSLQRVFLADTCGEVLAVQRPADQVRITVDVDDDAVAIADPTRLHQVLDNLVTNAVRYGGPNIQVSAVREGGRVRVTVRDDGAGVSPELVDTLYDAHVRRLCEAMSGTIEYDGSRGSTFTATFPAVPVSSAQLGVDVAVSGHSVAFWNADEDLMEDLLAYVANGLAVGEAVLVTATAAHHRMLAAELAAIGIDPVAATEIGQYLALDAESLHHELRDEDQVDGERFETLIGATVERIRGRWRAFRVFGEIVDLYWRAGRNDLALELEARWNQLRTSAPFPLLCSYELAHGDSAGAICAGHDSVVSA